MFQRFITKKQWLLKSFSILSILISLFFAGTVSADCKDQELRKKVTEAAKQEGVDENELLSIIAHESRCNYFVIAWNLPRRPETAKAKFFSSLEEAKSFAEQLISTKQYRVDVGIGQINNEAHLRPKGWALEEVLSPTTALNRVAFILRERGWKNYHSNNPVLAQKWQQLALNALHRTLSGSSLEKQNSRNLQIARSSFSSQSRLSSLRTRNSSPLLVFNRYPSSSGQMEKGEKPSWVILGAL